MPRPQVIGQPTTTKHFSMGIDAMADLLAPTLGPIGGVVANERTGTRKPEILDDSATSLRRILNLRDPRMDVGAMLMRSTVWRVVQRTGDGGATTAVLMRAIYREAMRIIAADANAMQMAKGINMAVEAALAAIEAQAKLVHSEDDLAKVAATVIREPGLANVVGEMSYLLGPDAHVTIEKFVAPYMQQFYHPGANYGGKIASMYLYTDQIQQRSIVPDGVIALVDGRLQDPDDIVPILEAASQMNAKSLTVIANHWSDEVIGIMVKNSRKPEPETGNGKEKAAEGPKMVITAATLKDVGDVRKLVYDDLALLTGATVAGRDWSVSPEMITPNELGKVTRGRSYQGHDSHRTQGSVDTSS